MLGPAASCVAAVRAGRSLSDALAAVPAPQRPAVQALSFHTLRRLAAARAVLALLAERPPPARTEALLLVALALLWRIAPDDPLPYAPHTVVDQAVTAERRRGGRDGFVNAVLRRWLRESEARGPLLRRDPVVARNLPAWWWTRLAADWPHEAEALAAEARRPPPMTLRVNRRRGDVDAYLARLAAAGLGARAAGGEAVLLDEPVPVDRLPGFADGDVSVQDLSAQRAAALLLAPAGDGLPPLPVSAGGRPRVLDACAAPGGKTAHLLESAELDLLAIDVDAQRLARVDDTLRRLGLQARTAVADAAQPQAWWDGRPFDAILLDAPCSGSGVVRRHPDIPWLRRESDLAALARGQDRLLEALWPLLAPGGRLLYATCSLFRAEGAERIDAFLQRHADARPAPPARSPGHLSGLSENAEPVAADGFFYALLIRSGHPPP